MPQKPRTPHPWRCPRPGWMGLWASRSGGRRPGRRSVGPPAPLLLLRLCGSTTSPGGSRGGRAGRGVAAGPHLRPAASRCRGGRAEGAGARLRRWRGAGRWPRSSPPFSPPRRSPPGGKVGAPGWRARDGTGRGRELCYL